jgi:hypothetical protein
VDFKMDHYFDWPVELICTAFEAGEDIIAMEDLPNVSQRKPLERHREGARFYFKNNWCVHGQIPKIAQKIVSAETLTFVEESVWDDNARAFTTRIVPHFFKDKIICRTTSAWSAAGPNRAKRTFSGTLVIKFPIFGALLEKTIIDHLKKNNEENARILPKGLEKRFGPSPK